MKIILFIIIIYFIFTYVMRLAAPYIAKSMMDKAAKKFEDQFNNPYYKEKPTTKEGETYIEKLPNEQKPKKNQEGGEYVDFEEVD